MSNPFHQTFDPHNTYVISDYHYGHKNICRGTSQWTRKEGCRDFETIEEMNEILVNSTNEVVGPDDILFHLGDWNFGHKDNAFIFRSQIHCANIYHIFGNHCHNIRSNPNTQQNCFKWCGDYTEIWTKDPKTRKKVLFVLSHYLFRVWCGSSKGSINLAGHSHGTCPIEGKQLDVGWEVFRRPISLYEAMVEVEDVDIFMPDHHDERTNVF